MLLGAAGMLAHDLRSSAPPGVTLLEYTHAELDVTDEKGITTTVSAERPDLIINAAAYTRVDEAESNPTMAFAVNATGPGSIGRAAAAVNAVVVHFSTDYIFDGRAERPYREHDEPNPLSTYGRSKLEGEIALRASGATHLIVRTQWLFGVHGRSFPRTMWERANRRQPTRVVNDQWGKPTFTGDLASAVWHLIQAGTRGTLHVANSGIATWYDLAGRVFATVGAESLLSPCTTTDYPTPAKRPAAAVLDTSRFEEVSPQPAPRWEDAVDRFVDALTSK